MHILQLKILILLFFTGFWLIEGKKSYPKYGHKLKNINDKIIVTSSKVGGSFGDWFKDHNVGIEESDWFNEKYKDCLKLDLHVPENYDPLYICLKKQKAKYSAFHKNFKLNIYKKDGLEVLTLDDVLKSAVEGHVIGMGVSFVRGYIDKGNFYGTIVYKHLIRKQMITCTVNPETMIKNFVDWDVLDELTAHKLEEAKKMTDGTGNSIVSCGDMHRNDDDDVENPFTFLGGHNPTNVNSKNKEATVRRVKRNDDAPAPDSKSNNSVPSDEPAIESPQQRSQQSEPRSAISQLGRSLIGPSPRHRAKNATGGGNSSEAEDLKKESDSSKSAQRTVESYLKVDKHGTYYAQACYTVDSDFLTNRLNFSAEEVTLMIGGFVELSDWVLRSTDWDKDGIPDNLGIRLLEVNIDFITKQIRPNPQDDPNKWGREEGGKFDSRHKVFDIVKEMGTKMNADCDIRTGIADVNAAKFVLHEPGGCTACKHNKMTSFMNPYVEKYSPRGEYMRMMYHQIRLLTFSLVYTKNYCANCTDNGKIAKLSSAAGSFDTGDPNFGSCIVEGDLQSRSNLPLNTFRLSVCSQDDGLACLKDLAQRDNCLEFESEESYCGNGIVEGDEECDCGTLATCAEQHCTCSPRTGLNPCRKLHHVESRLCFTLIRCRGFRFLYEFGRSNASHFLAALPDLLLHQSTSISSRKGKGTKLSIPGIGTLIFLTILAIVKRDSSVL